MIKRTGPPRAIQKKAEGYFVFEVPLSGCPNADWLDRFGAGNISYTSMFVPKMVDFYGDRAQFDSEVSRIDEHIRLFDGWVEETNRLYAEALATHRAAQERDQTRREAEAREIEELNKRLSNS